MSCVNILHQICTFRALTLMKFSSKKILKYLFSYTYTNTIDKQRNSHLTWSVYERSHVPFGALRRPCEDELYIPSSAQQERQIRPCDAFRTEHVPFPVPGQKL